MLNDKRNYDAIKQIVLDVLSKNKLLQGNWHLGKVTRIISSTKLKVLVDGGEVAQTISCNPDIVFNVDDEIWVIFINGNGRDKFALCKRAIE